MGKIVDRLHYVSRVALEHVDFDLRGGPKIPIDDIRTDSEFFGPLLPSFVVPQHIPKYSTPRQHCLRHADDRAHNGPAFEVDVYEAQREILSSLESSRSTNGQAIIRGGRAGHYDKVCTCVKSLAHFVLSPIIRLQLPIAGFASFRRIAITEAGRKCLVHFKAEAGDAIAIVHGCPVPLILRARPDDKYALVGEAYVEGIMNGEVVDWAEQEADELILV